MGFCLFNNVAVAAAHALEAHGLERVAIVDFDVHHGNGTEDIFRNDPRVMLCSTFQHPFYPFCGADTVSDHIVNVPLPAGTTGPAYREPSARASCRGWKPSVRRCCCFPPASTATVRTTWRSLAGGIRLRLDHRTGDGGRRTPRGKPHRLGAGRRYDLSSLGRSVAAHIRTLADL